ncbi:MAG TPA: helix-turn-helix domain-containing protein [Thermoanaerobaculia bacterium]|nr:helix-turn-helix domain-containing protein [Thermoanaerobaculia bacterium]
MQKIKRSVPAPATPPSELTAPERRLLTAFGRRLAHLRRERGLSQKAIARELAIGEELVSKYERGLHAPRLGTLLKLRTLLSVSLDYLVAGAASPGITDPHLLEWAQAANQLPPDHRKYVAEAVQDLVQAARRIVERETRAEARK